MPPVSVEAFASEFRNRPASDRTAFVAALWNARGWETTVEADTVVAEREDERRRIRVVDPGRFGTPDLDGVDVLVVARDRAAVRDAAADAGVAYVPPAELRDLLLYGIERDTAARLYTEWFDHPLQRSVADDGAESSVVDRARAGFPAIGEQRRVIVAVLVVALLGVVVAGPPLTGGDGPAQSPITVANVTPGEADGGAIGAESPTATAIPGLSPGVTRAGVVDPMALAEAHMAGVRNRSRTVTWELTSPADATTGASTFRNATIGIANTTHYQQERLIVQADGNESERITDDIYAGGTDVFRRLTFPDRTRYERYDLGSYPATEIDARVETYLYRYFVGADAVVTCAIKYDTDCPTYRVEIDSDTPAALPGEVEEYEALLIVSDRGVITTIRASYTLPDSDDDGEREQVRFALDYQFEDVDVTAPAWVPEARNATASGTATGTATENTTVTGG